MDEMDTVIRLSEKVNLLSHTNREKDASIAELRAENIRLRGEVDMYKGALEMMQPAPKEQSEHGMGAMPPPIPDEVAQLRDDRRVLVEEVKAWRRNCGGRVSVYAGTPDAGKWWASRKGGIGLTIDMPEADTTDASGVLGRVT
jgi:hypothetical protein